MIETMTNSSLQINVEDALLEERNFTASLIDTAQIIILVLDLEGKIVSFNPYMEQLSGYLLSEVKGKDWFDVFLLKQEHSRIRKIFEDALSGTLVIGNINPILTKKGDERLIEWNVKTLKNINDDLIGVLSVGQDITEKKQSEQKLQLAANVFSNTREGIMITDSEANIVEVNDSFERITGYERKEILGQNPRFLQSGKQRNEFYINMWHELLEKGYWSGEIWNRHKKGHFFAELLTISVVRDVKGVLQNFIGLFTDITQQKKHQEQLEYIAHHDVLTSLPNRILLTDRLEQYMAYSKRGGQKLAVAYIDLDNFKDINDTFGHDVGDKLLLTLAKRLKKTLREGDTIARIGGDEFVALLIDLKEKSDSLPYLNRILSNSSKTIHINDIVVQVSASIGVTYYPQADDCDADKLLRQADQAMYQAKLSGKNHYHLFDSDQDRHLRGRHASLKRIHDALYDNEFVLYFQPKVNLRSGKILSAEALIRWQHPDQGLLAPFYFLPVIENDPLTLEVDQWVIDSALTQMEEWKKQGLHIPLSVNISAHFLNQPDTVERLKALLAEHVTLNPDDLILEIVESNALEDMEHVIQIIRGCNQLGINFALDDFGTGYSSLTYLKRLPVTQLKIDQSFIRNMLDDPDDLSILQGVLDLARAFKLKVIVEGVETKEHVELLLRLGCEYLQGYAIAKPMSAKDLLAWSATWKPDQSWGDMKPIYRSDLPLLFASVDHRAWIRNLVEFFRGNRTVPPPVNHHQCRFGQWLYEEGTVRFSKQPPFKKIVLLHRQVHSLALELCELKNNGQNSQVFARLDELYILRDRLLGYLNELLKEAERNILSCDINV